jgi:hypothetical protein
LKNITAPQLIDLIKSSVEFDGTDVHITVDDLIGLNHSVTPLELVSVLTQMPGVTITDPKFGGIIIPKSYFE